VPNAVGMKEEAQLSLRGRSAVAERPRPPRYMSLESLPCQSKSFEIITSLSRTCSRVSSFQCYYME